MTADLTGGTADVSSDVRWLIDGYLEWLGTERVPICEDNAIDLVTVPTGRWERMGVDAAFVHLTARDDQCSLYVLDLAPGENTRTVRHMYEALYFVLEGNGAVVVERNNGEQITFEFGHASLFSLPLNARYTIYNHSGVGRTRIAVTTNLPMVMKQFRDPEFVFNTPYDFEQRWGSEDTYKGDGVFIPTFEMRHMWETNLVPSVLSFSHVVASPNRGNRSANIQFVMGESTMRSHISEVGVGDYKKAHIHEAGANIIQLTGEGYSLYWYDGEPYRRVDWRFGLLHSPADNEWHQHFNVGDEPGRYLPSSFGNFRYPFSRANRANILHRYSIKSRKQIEYEDEDPYIRELFNAERARYLASRS
jgi:mannose-6-phosphate isomerase-like protein (cupin superfamily)